MITPHLKEEKALIKNGYQYIAGIDEAGRGALAGSVVAAAVIMPHSRLHVEGVRDSKLLTAKKREGLFDEILKCCLGYGVGIIENEIIDEVNIYEATKLAMKAAVENINNVIPRRCDEESQRDPSSLKGFGMTNVSTSIVPDYLLIDAMRVETKIPQKAIINGDILCYSISCASIIAKVTRDRLMRELHREYPDYGFDRHKGYGTKIHLESLEKHGPCKVHRNSYAPIAKLIKLEL